MIAIGDILSSMPSVPESCMFLEASHFDRALDKILPSVSNEEQRKFVNMHNTLNKA